MPPSIRIENVSKLYRLGEVGTGTLSHDLHRAWARLRGKPDPFAKVGQLNDRTVASASPSTSSLVASTSPAPRPSFLSRLSPLATRRSADASADYVWALKDINLEIEQGEIVGIIGRNGAGKSTLLKLLSRITEPTTGRILTKGRIASLLEVGTGFHPELTGRENIYLNGSILGMRRHEITKHLEEIVEFSGCEKYIDTPVKRYSSGMTVRLGFSVAAHLNCEILVVDEVLAVGDGEFQQRCLGRMQDMRSDGRTVLFVSHQMSMITALCKRGVVLRNGRIAFDGAVEDAVINYQSATSTHGNGFDAKALGIHAGDDRSSLRRVWLEDCHGSSKQSFDIDEAIRIKMEFELHRDDIPWPYVNFHLFDASGKHLCVTSGKNYPVDGETSEIGVYIAECIIPGNFLNTGNFTIGAAATCIDRGVNVCFWQADAVTFQITEDMMRTLQGSRNGFAGSIPGPIRPTFEWKIVKTKELSPQTR